MIVYIIIIIAVVSVLWAVLSLRNAIKNPKTIKEVKKELSKGRVIYSSELSDKSS
ncbi:MAG: hypothetical protein M1268_02005 [Patescibacteria group bacterium]|nr:hypothetical protein [Patescibacteria group bacterium]